MSQFPNQFDSDIDLPRVDDNITEIGGDAINALRSAVFNIENNIGLDAQGTMASIAARLAVSILPDGYLNPSIMVGFLSTIQITNAQVASGAAIDESKLNLNFPTANLFNLISALQTSVNILDGFLSLTGIKLEPHIDGTNYNHLLSAILIDPLTQFLKTNPSTSPTTGTNVVNRNTTNADLLVKDISDDLIVHEKSDGNPNVTPLSGGTVPPINYAHMASGIFVESSGFTTIPQSAVNVQEALAFIDNSSSLLIGGRIQNFYANGIPRTARSSSLLNDGYGPTIIPPTPAVAYFLSTNSANTGPSSSSPVDSFIFGDDVIEFMPTAPQLDGYEFQALFSQVEPGDIITINYGTGISYQFIIDSVKSLSGGQFTVRINGKNPVSNSNAIARIDKSLFNRNKYGVLATARAPNNISNTYESLIIANPKSAVALGNGLDLSAIDSAHYNLYLYLLPTGNISSIITLPAIDITGNQGTTPGAYTIDSIIDTINTAFRRPGFNYRFIAFQYQGQIGIMLADPYNNASFSILGGIVDTNGNYIAPAPPYANNVVDNFNQIDPLGFGTLAANIASPPPSTSYSSANAAIFNPTLLFYPLRRNFYYTNGSEKDTLKSDPLTFNGQQDSFGDGYWFGTIISSSVIVGVRVEVTYNVEVSIADADLKVGKTIVVQPVFPVTDPRYNPHDYGRFIISGISFTNCQTDGYITLTVYDGVHGVGSSGLTGLVSPNGTPVGIYFSDDSASFDAENVFDISFSNPYKRFFENYVDGNGHTFAHERARFLNNSSALSNINFYKVSPKLTGLNSIAGEKSLRLQINNYNNITGLFDGYLCDSLYTPSSFGPHVTGKKGDIVRFYDNTSIDYIDFIFNINTVIPAFSSEFVDIQFFKTLELDQEVMLVSSCQIDDITFQISYLKDERQFGNVSEEQLSSSAIDYISASDRLLRENGVISGFGNLIVGSNTISFDGGSALLNGKVTFLNSSVTTIPVLVESVNLTTVNTITWFVCLGQAGIELVASTDFPLWLSNTYGSFNENRLFMASNPNVVAPAYPIRGTYFDDLVSNNNDLVPLYVVTATVSGTRPSVAVSSLTASDARRFISGGYGGLQNSFVLSPLGSFRTFDALNTWLIQLLNLHSAISNPNNVGSTVLVRGNITVSNSPTLDYNYQVIFKGDGGMITVPAPSTAFSSFPSAGIKLGNNVKFDGVAFNYTYDPVAAIDSNYTSGLLSNINGGMFYCNMQLLSGGSNWSLTNGSDQAILSGSTTVSVGQKIVFSSQPMAIYTVAAFDGSGTITLDRVYNDINASGVAAAYAGVKNISITNCVFNSPLQNRFPFVVFSLGSPMAFVENVDISSNIFQTTFINADDKLAVVAFYTSSAAAVTSLGPRLTNCSITKNYCNKNQLIIVSSSLQGSDGTVINGMITAVNTRITQNTCGAINVLVGRDYPLSITNSIFIQDKSEELIVEYNTCKFIYTGASNGSILDNLNANRVIYDINSGFNLFTGSVFIANNVCSFIHVGYRVPNGAPTSGTSPLIIRKNKLTASNKAFLTDYYNGIVQTNSDAIIVDKVTGN